MAIGYYGCKCGKEFTEPNKFNAHKSHCRIHLGEEKFNARNYLHMKKMSSLGLEAIKAAKEKREEIKQAQLEQWVSEQPTCERCGKILTEKYASGRFCSKSCACSRDWSEEDKALKRKTVLKTLSQKQVVDATNWKTKHISGYYNGIWCASSYEILFLYYCSQNGISVTRCPFKFHYVWKGKERMYCPDFYLPDTNTIVETKGKGIWYDDDVVQLKKKVFQDIIILFSIIQILMKNIFLDWLAHKAFQRTK